MRNIFIDAGSYNGITARLFRAKYGEDWTVHCFEPDSRIENNEPGIILHREAIWTHDGDIALYVGRPESSSVIREKRTGNLDVNNPVSVPCVDFSRWLKGHVEPADNVVVKLNVEGAEYPILDHLMNEGTIGLIDKLLVEWHLGKVPITKDAHRDIVKRVRRTGIKLRSIWGTDWLR